MGAFKTWLQNEISVGTGGAQDNRPTQTSQATSQVATNWMNNKKNVDTQSQLMQGVSNRSLQNKALMTASTQAIQQAPRLVAQQTAAPMVATAIQTNMGLPQTMNPVKPAQAMMMRKK